VIVVPVSVRGTAAVRDALLSHGWEGDVASLTAGGLSIAGLHVYDVPQPTLEAMVPLAARLGLELVTGEDWLILAGPRARLGAFARPWVQPEPVRELAMAVGMALPADTPREWQHGRGAIRLDAPVIVGVVNVTPDSFSVSTRTTTATAVLERIDALRQGGATVVDVGGESTRPGAEPVPPDEERARVIPMIHAIVAGHPDLTVSVDTVHAATARAALDAGAAIVNDVTAGRHDPALLGVVASAGSGLVLSHSRGPLGALANIDPLVHDDGDVTGVVVRELDAARQLALQGGVDATRVVLDPGFGFGKSAAQNWRLLDALDAVVSLGAPVLVGVSRKRFLGDATGRPVEERDAATAAACALAWDRGARLFRVHNPAAVRDALAVAAAMSPA
jgi:dihydropteroate synthase